MEEYSSICATCIDDVCNSIISVHNCSYFRRYDV